MKTYVFLIPIEYVWIMNTHDCMKFDIKITVSKWLKHSMFDRWYICFFYILNLPLNSNHFYVSGYKRLVRTYTQVRAHTSSSLVVPLYLGLAYCPFQSIMSYLNWPTTNTQYGLFWNIDEGYIYIPMKMFRNEGIISIIYLLLMEQ